MAGASQTAGDSGEEEETERLMNREVKNDKDDADPRQRVDKALNGLFSQVKKNMDKFVDVNRNVGGSSLKGPSGSKDMFKTLDPKGSQVLEHPGVAKKNFGGSSGDTKLPPIGKKPTQKDTKQGGGPAPKGLSRNASK